MRQRVRALTGAGRVGAGRTVCERRPPGQRPTLSGKACAAFAVIAALSFVIAVTGRADETVEDTADDQGAGRVDFGRQIRPILAENCLACHGLDGETREADLRLDTEEGLFAELEDGPLVERGNSTESLLYQVLVTKRKSRRMPPRKSKKELTSEEIELVRRWIDQGAEWKRHWSYVAPTRPDRPVVSRPDWMRTEIDAFVLARLDREGIAPSEEADRSGWLRRVSFDLIGLPPSPEDIAAFEADRAPGAYGRVVDRLLGSAEYGEHMGRYWLDAARYADTHGLHLDNVRTMWPYRDWVIDAFNANRPFDEFTIEQLAGDLLPDATIDQRVATGFLRAHVTTNEGGVIPAEYDVHYTVDRVATMSTVWMGTSMGCVRCHEHKFDPFDQKDFYSLYAFFNNLDGPVMDGNRPLPDPVLRAPNRENRARIAALEPSLDSARSRVTARVADALADAEFARRVDGMQVEVAPVEGLRGHWTFDPPPAEREEPADSTTKVSFETVPGRVGGACSVDEKRFVDLGDAGRYDGSGGFSYGAWVRAKRGNQGGAIIARMDDEHGHRGYDLYVSGDRVIAHLIHDWPKNAIKVEAKQRIELDRWQHVFVTYDGSGSASGVKLFVGGEPSPTKTHNDSLTEAIATDVPLHVGRRATGSRLRGLVDDVRIYDRALQNDEIRDIVAEADLADILVKPSAERSDDDRRTLATFVLDRSDVVYREMRDELRDLEAEKRRLEKEDSIATLVWRERSEIRPAHVLRRGEYDKPGEAVSRATPKALPAMVTAGESPTRLDLARWLVSPEHPLTSRVTVNRLWQQFFGVGIVKTTEDFGSQGEAPSHPELLDWLAVEFRESGWDVKALVRTIVLSATYRQTSAADPDEYRRDPENRLLARGPRFRLDAEVVRDNALAVSGLLVRRSGGKSVKPYQPPGIWKAVGYTDSNTANFTRDAGSALYRRSLYSFWKRTAPPPSLVALDAPSRENCTVRRSRTNTPLAALALMNDEQFVEASRQLATRMVTEGGGSTESRLRRGVLLVLSREPEAAEIDVLSEVLEKARRRFESEPAAAKSLVHVGESEPSCEVDEVSLAAWTVVGNLLLNLDETVTKE